MRSVEEKVFFIYCTYTQDILDLIQWYRKEENIEPETKIFKPDLQSNCYLILLHLTFFLFTVHPQSHFDTRREESTGSSGLLHVLFGEDGRRRQLRSLHHGETGDRVADRLATATVRRHAFGAPSPTRQSKGVGSIRNRQN